MRISRPADRLALLAVLGSCGLVAGCAPGSGEKPIVVRFTHVAAAFTPKGLAATKFAELVNERSQGRVEVRVYSSGQLFGDKDEIEALQANNTQFIAPSIGKLISFDQRFQLGDMPFLFADNAAESRFWAGETGRALLQSLEPQGFIGLATWPNGMRQLMNRRRPIRTPGDMKGLKFRIPSGGVLVDALQALGAGAAVVPFTETYTALQQGVVDGTMATFDNISNEKYAEVLEYLTVINLNSLSYAVLVNKAFWNGLPPDLRAIMSQAMDEATAFAVETAARLDRETLESLKAQVEIYELSPEERAVFVEAARRVWTEYEPAFGRELFEAAQRANP